MVCSVRRHRTGRARPQGLEREAEVLGARPRPGGVLEPVLGHGAEHALRAVGVGGAEAPEEAAEEGGVVRRREAEAAGAHAVEQRGALAREAEPRGAAAVAAEGEERVVAHLRVRGAREAVQPLQREGPAALLAAGAEEGAVQAQRLGGRAVGEEVAAERVADARDRDAPVALPRSVRAEGVREGPRGTHTPMGDPPTPTPRPKPDPPVPRAHPFRRHAVSSSASYTVARSAAQRLSLGGGSLSPVPGCSAPRETAQARA